VATALSERPARGDLPGEVCHWADGYHLNIKLYVAMLSSVFDVLEEGKLAEVFSFSLKFVFAHYCLIICSPYGTVMFSYT
jgi:hypothetical protein